MSLKERNLWIVIGVLAVGMIGYVAWTMYGGGARPGGQQPGPTAAEPSAESEKGWKTSTQLGLTFTYPETLPEVYIHTVDWPPKLQVVPGPFTCTEGGNADARAGKTSKVTIDGHAYCRTEVTEGAAGSIYTQYAYARERDGQVVIMTFSLRFEQCANYEEPKKTACETERANFDIGGTVDAMMSSLR